MMDPMQTPRRGTTPWVLGAFKKGGARGWQPGTGVAPMDGAGVRSCSQENAGTVPLGGEGVGLVSREGGQPTKREERRGSDPAPKDSDDDAMA